MNRLTGQILAVESHKGMSLVQCATAAGTLKAVVLDNCRTAPWISIGQNLSFLFKETETWPVPANQSIPSPHFLWGTLEAIRPGQILTRLDIRTLAGPITSILDREWLQSLEISPGDTLRVCVHPTAIALADPKGVYP